MTTIPATDLDVFPLCLGGNPFGWTLDERRSFAVLDAYAAGGGNFIDTADVYSDGASETIIGSWMAARGNRDAMIVATKVGGHGGLGAAPSTRSCARARRATSPPRTTTPSGSPRRSRSPSATGSPATSRCSRTTTCSSAARSRARSRSCARASGSPSCPTSGSPRASWPASTAPARTPSRACAPRARGPIWMLAQPTVVAPIASARTPEQLAELLPMAQLRLSDEQIARLTVASETEAP